MKNILSKLATRAVAAARRTYEQRVDSVVDVITQRAFPVQVYFLKDGLAIGILRMGSAKSTHDEIAPPGTLPTFAVKADDPMALVLLQRVLQHTELGHIPRGVIRDAVREAWRRKFNQLQLEKMGDQANDAIRERLEREAIEGGFEAETDNLKTAAIMSEVFKGGQHGETL